MRYVDGYVLPVLKKNLHAYRRKAQKAGKFGVSRLYSPDAMVKIETLAVADAAAERM
jgi:uncharacterized protein YbaA (DUF1428 family)